MKRTFFAFFFISYDAVFCWYFVRCAERRNGNTENRGNDFGTPFRVRSMADDDRPFFFPFWKCHQRYDNFFFNSDTLLLRKWVYMPLRFGVIMYGKVCTLQWPWIIRSRPSLTIHPIPFQAGHFWAEHYLYFMNILTISLESTKNVFEKRSIQMNQVQI